MIARARWLGPPMAGKRVLILGGTNEALDLAARLNPIDGLEIISSLAGVTANPRVPDGIVRRGGYGGADGLAAYLRDEAIAAVIDATHPHATRISDHAEKAGAAARVPVLHLIRGSWRATTGDNWHEVESAREAAGWLESSGLPDGAGVLLTIGRSNLMEFNATRRLRLIARSIETPGQDVIGLLDRVILDRGPFTFARERQLLVDQRIACVVSKNSGGMSSYPKIEAARDLGLPVVMIREPTPPTGLHAHGVTEAVTWITERLA